MATGIIEINDAGIRTALDSEIKGQSAGFAVLDGDRLLVGEEAQRSARLLPRWTNNRFWNQLGMDRLPNGTATIRHHADLAFAHLEQVWQGLQPATDSVVLAVPGFYSREQLGLLLGMAKECGMPVTGVADTSLLAASSAPDHANIIHLDIFLHRITITVLRADATLRRFETITVSESGLFTLWDRWANIIASQFIQSSRFDPMHQAVSEQRLFDLLPGWITALGESRTHPFMLEIGDNRREVAVSQEQLIGACATVYPQIVQRIRDYTTPGTTTALLISDRFKGFPGLKDSLGLVSGVLPIWLDANSVQRGAVNNLERIVSGTGTVSHITSLPVTSEGRTGTTPGAPEPAQAAERQPSHVLFNHHAYPVSPVLHIRGITDGRLVLGDDGARVTLYARGKDTILENRAGASVTLNGGEAPVQSILAAGDVVTIDNEPLTLIRVI